MAAPLSQDEIDALLNSTDDSMDGDDSGFEPDFTEDEPKRGGTKNFEIPEVAPYRFKFNYLSPVIKSKRYIYNPDEEPVEDKEEETLVVRSIFNYAAARKHH
ncbi:MAG: hypothetical protein GY863_10770 [bacterium]|nr:hypothetical protein [bacterium]